MPPAARVGDTTNHGGTITGPGVATVLIGGMPAAVVGDLHVCSLPPTGHQPTVSAFPAGSTTVLISGRPALRITDACICGAMAAVGEPTVIIG
ncbi:MAG: PaaR repeat-containing protein [Deltaproteobacteria bacterium RIFOXYD12_FULL_57_12]|nr:MAG: PaaR repeat-containing protein [Deltaproteobacteria bacterium RIFOXYD12_FULL_57_12]